MPNRLTRGHGLIGKLTLASDLILNADISMPGATGTHDWKLADNVASALDIEIDGGNKLITFVTSNAAEVIVFNEDGSADLDVRMEGDTDANLFFLDASADKIGIGGNAPQEKLDVVTGNLQVKAGDLKFPGASGTHDIVLADNAADALAISGGAADLMNFVTTNNAEEVVVNESGDADIDFRVESDNITAALKVDAGLDRVELGGATALTGDLTPTALAGNVDNYDPTNLARNTVLRLDPNGASRNITGLAGGADGRVIVICNISTTATQTLVLKHEDAASTAANRFIGTDGTDTGDVTIQPGGAVMCIYDSTSSRWRVLVAK